MAGVTARSRPAAAARAASGGGASLSGAAYAQRRAGAGET